MSVHLLNHPVEICRYGHKRDVNSRERYDLSALMFTRATFQEAKLPFRDRINQGIDAQVLPSNVEDKVHFLDVRS